MDFFCREVSNFCRGEQILKWILLVPRKCSSKSLWQPMCHITRISIPPCQGGESLSALYAVRPAKVNWRKPPQHFAASENKSTLLQEVEKRHEHRVHITKKCCAELDVAARLRLNYCNYHFRPAKSVSRWTKRCRDACRPAPPFSPDETSSGSTKKAGRGIPRSAFLKCVILYYSTTGPAATRALPASLFSYFLKFLTKRPARSLAFSSQTDASA